MVDFHAMSERRKANVEGSAYFLTLTVVDWVDVFTRKKLVDELLNVLQLGEESDLEAQNCQATTKIDAR